VPFLVFANILESLLSLNKILWFMFIGDFAVGLAAKSVKPSISLGTYFVAVQFVDLLWPTLLVLGIEQVAIEPGITEMTPLNFLHYPITHSLVMALVWALAGFLLYYMWKKDARAGILIAACVASHWVLDFITHRPDLPLTLAESTKVGLGMWDNKILTVLVETLLFAAGLFLYLRSTHTKDKTGTYAFWGLIVFLLVIHVSNVFGPPPPNVEAIAWAGQLQWLFVIWAYWADAHRTTI
jgi:membrane-bound metal-dependent hydrolase YbcI (DUF457 family)